MDLGDIVVCKTIVKEGDPDNLDWEWHYYGPVSAGNQHYGPDWVQDELLKENPRNPETWARINGWSGTTEDREELHERFSERSHNREWNEWRDNHHDVDEDHHKWEANQLSSQYQPWEYGVLVGTPHPDNREVDKDQLLQDADGDESVAKRNLEELLENQMFYTGTPKTTGYPEGYKDDDNNYPFRRLEEEKFQQGWRNRNQFKDMYGMDPDLYVDVVYQGFEPVKPGWVDYVDPAGATIPEDDS